MAKDTIVTVRMDGEFWEAVKSKARDEGTNASAVVLTLLQAWMDERIDIHNLQDREVSVQDEGVSGQSIQQRLDAMQSQIQALTEAMGKQSGGSNPHHHHPESYGNPANFMGQNPDRQSLRDKLPA